jgi:hypothetical protein
MLNPCTLTTYSFMTPNNEHLTQKYRLLYYVREVDRLCFLSHGTHTASTTDSTEDKIRRLYKKNQNINIQLLNHNQLRHRRKNTIYS